MPRRRVLWSGRKKGLRIPPGVKAAALADQLAGGRTIAETARSFGLDPLTVKKLAETLAGIEPGAVQRIQEGLPRLLTVLAASHAAEALERVQSDPAMAVKSTFGAKLAVEAGRLTGPSAAGSGETMLALIKALNQAGGGSVTVSVEATPSSSMPAPVVLEVVAELADERPSLPSAELEL